MVSIFEVDGDGVSVLIGTTQVSVAEMQRGARDTPPRRFALVNHEGTETGHVAFLGASAGPRPVIPSAISIPGRPVDAGQADGSAPVVIGAESPMAGPLTPATAATYPRQGRLRPRSPPPPTGDAGEAADSGSASDASGFAASGGAGKAAGGARAEDVAAAAAERRLDALRKRVEEMNEHCRTAEDANARAARETKWRQELQEDKRALQERVQSVLSDLRREETGRLDAERRAQEASRRADAAVATAERARAEAEAPRGPSPRAAAADAQRLRAALDESTAHKQAAAIAVAKATTMEASLKKAEAAAVVAARELARARAESAATEKALRARARAAEEAAAEAKAAADEAEARAAATSRVVADGFASAARALGLSLTAGSDAGDGSAVGTSSVGRTGDPSGPHAGVPRAVLDADWEAWDAALIAAAVEAVASAAAGLATASTVSQSNPASPAAKAPAGSATDADSESAAAAAVASAELRRQMALQGADHARAVEDKNKLIREWEHYANHWERRGRDAERTLKRLEAEAESARRRAEKAERERDGALAELAKPQDAAGYARPRRPPPARDSAAAGSPLPASAPPSPPSPPAGSHSRGLSAERGAALVDAGAGHSRAAQHILGSAAAMSAGAGGSGRAPLDASVEGEAVRAFTGRVPTAASLTSSARRVPASTVQSYSAAPTASTPSPPTDPPASAVRITARSGRPFHASPARRTPETGIYSPAPGRVPVAGQGAHSSTGTFFA